MEIKQIINTFQRWFWLLIIGLLIGGLSGYITSKIQQPVYLVVTKVLVSRAKQSDITNFLDLSDNELVQTYVELILTQPILDNASTQLGFEVVKSNVLVEQTPNTKIIEVAVEDQDPKRGVSIANSLVNALIDYNNELNYNRFLEEENSLLLQITQVEEEISNLQTQYNLAVENDTKEQLALVEQEIVTLENEITQLQKQIAQLENSTTLTALGTAEIAEKQSRVAQLAPLLTQYQEIRVNLLILGRPYESSNVVFSPQIEELQSRLDLYSQLYLSLVDNLESVRLSRLENSPTIFQIEVASTPDNPIRPIPVLYTLLAGVVGLIISGGAIVLIDQLDDTLKTLSDVQNALGLPIIGSIIEDRNARNLPSEPLIITNGESQVADAFRSLKISIDNLSHIKPLNTLLVVSAVPNEGKTTVAVNLAAIFSQAGKKVMLVDADLRRPRVHDVLGLEAISEIIDLADGKPDLDKFSYSWNNGLSLNVVSLSNLIEDPKQVLESGKTEKLLSDLQRLTDVVVIDCPPIFIATAQALASQASGVLLVVQPWKTHSKEAVNALESLRQVGANILGVVLNRIPQNRAGYDIGYRSYSSYYIDPNSNTKKRLRSEKRI